MIEGMEVTYPSKGGEEGPNIISQEMEDAPAYRTRSQSERVMAAMEISGCTPTPAKLASRQFPASFFGNFANAVLDQETGEMLEYRQLIKRPKYKEDWFFSFGNELDG